MNAALPTIPRITVEPVKLNERLWELHGKCAAGTMTDAERRELDVMCAAAEAEQDNRR